MEHHLTADSIKNYIQKLQERGLSFHEIQKNTEILQKYLYWLVKTKRIAPTQLEVLNSAIKNQLKELFQENVQVQSVEKKESILKERLLNNLLSFNSRLGALKLNTLQGQFPVQSFIGLILMIIFLGALGGGVYTRFFVKPETPLAFPSTLTRAGRILSYQGRLTDSLGNPITTSTNLRFRLYSVSSGGSSLYDSGTCAITPDQDGIFNSLIGDSCGAEIGSAIFTENANIFIGTTVASDSEMTPRQQIANVGYAINSETLQGLPPGSQTSNIPYINQAGDLLIAATNGSNTSGIRATASSVNFTVSSANAVTIQSASTGDITLDATGSGALVFKNSTHTSTFDSSGDLKIGGGSFTNTSGSEDLYVTGNVEVDGTIYGNITGTNINPGFTTGSVAFQGASGLTEDNSNFFFDNSNNRLGIGNNAPLEALSVTGNASLSGNLTLGNGSVIKPAYGPLKLQYKSGLDTYADALTIQSTTGNVGIGTISPSTPLHVIGAGTFSSTLTTGSSITSGASYILAHTGSVAWKNTSVTTAIWDTDDNATSFGATLYGQAAKFQIRDASNNPVFHIDTATPKVGIGTITPTSKLHLTGAITGKALAIFDETGDQDIFTASSSATPRFIIGNNGDVKVGPSGTFNNPSGSEDLYVKGNLEVDGVIYGDGSGLTNLGASTIADDSLDFDKFQDTLDLDAALTLNQTTNTWSQTFTGTNTTGLTYTASSLTSGEAIDITTAATAFTGNLLDISSTGNNASNTGNLLRLTTAASDAITPAMITNLGTGNSFRVNDETGDADTSPFIINNSGNVGIGTTTISAKVHSLATTEQLRLGYDASNYVSFTTSSGGDLTVLPSGGDLNLTGRILTSISDSDNSTIANFSAVSSYNGGSNKIGLQGNLYGNGTSTVPSFIGLRGQVLSSSGAYSAANYQGLVGAINYQATSGTLTNATGVYSSVANTGAATITNAYGLGIGATINSGGGTVSNNTGISIVAQTAGTNNIGLSIGEATGTKNTNILVGTLTQPTGSYSIYNSSTDDNYFAGNTGIGTTAPIAKLHTEGKVVGKALAIFNETGDQDILTASASGTTRLIVNNNGDVRIGPSGTFNNPSGSEDLYVKGNLEVDGIIYGDGSGITGIASAIADDSLDFNKFEDTLDLDASTEINFGANNFTFDLDSTGDFIIADNGTPYFTFSDTGTLTQAGSGQVTLTGNVDATAGLDVTGSSLTVGGSNFSVTTAGAITGTSLTVGTGTITSGAITTTGTLTFSGVTTDITTGTDQDLILLANGTGVTKIGDLTTNGVVYTSGTDGTLNTEAQLAIARGGTNSTATPTAGGVAYGTGSAYAFTGQGSSGQCLVSNVGSAPSWTNCVTGATTVAWSAITDPTANLSLSHADYASTFTWDTPATSNARDALSLAYTVDAGTDATAQRLLVLNNNDDGGATGTLERLLVLDNKDANEAVTTGLEIVGSSTGTITTAIDISDGEIGTGISLGANDITGTTAVIDFSNFDVATTGNITIASGQGLDTNAGSGTLNLGSTNATTVNIGNAATTNFGGGYASTGVSISAAGNLQAAGTLTVDSTSLLTDVATMTAGFDSNAASTVAGLTVDGNGNLTVSNGTLSVTSPSTTGNANTFTANSLTTGSLSNFTSSNNSAANTAWSANKFNVTNAQGTTAVSSGSIAGVDVQFTQNTSVNTNTETVARFNIAQNNSSSTDNTVSSIIDIANNDTATGNQITATNGLVITGSNITNGISLSGTFGTNLITSTNFTVTQAGGITGAGDLDINGTSNDIAGTLNLSGNILASTGDLTIDPTGGGVKIGTGSPGTIDMAGDDLYVTADLEVDGVIYGNGSGLTNVGAANISDDSLDFAQFQDTLDLDAALTLNQTTNTWAQTFTGTTGPGFSYTASGAVASGNAAAFDIIASNASTSVPAVMISNAGSSHALRVNDDGTTTDSTPFVITAAGDVAIGATSASQKLDVNGSIRGDSFIDSSNATYLLDPAATGNSLVAAGSILLDGNAAINGGNITTTSGTFNLVNAATTLNIGSTNVTRAINMGTGSNADTIAIGGGATNADTINIGNSNVGHTITIGNTGVTGLSLTDNNWNISTGGAANFVSIGATTRGSGQFTTLDANGDVILGSDGSDQVTVNADLLTFSIDTNVVLSGGVNGLSFNTDTLSIDASNGRVGIGTTTPGEKLEIYGSDPTARIRNSGDTGGMFSGNTWNSAQFGMYNPSGSTWGSIAAGAKQSFFGFNNSGVVGSLTNTFGSPTFRNVLDDGSGNVGIGTTSTAGKLHIVTTAVPLVIKESDQAAGAGYWRLVTDGDKMRIDKNTSGADNFSTYGNPFNFSSTVVEIGGGTSTGGAWTPTITAAVNNGFVGIGTTTPIAKLDLVGDFIQTSGNNYTGNQMSMVNNAGFEINADGTSTVADTWTTNNDTGSPTYNTTTTSPFQGERMQQIILPGGGSAVGRIYSLCFPITNSTSYRAGARATTSTSSYSYVLGLETYTSQANCSSRSSKTDLSISAGTISTVTSFVGTASTASTARWGRAYFTASSSNAQTGAVDAIMIVPDPAGTNGIDLAERFPVDPNNVPAAGEIVSFSNQETTAQYVIRTNSISQSNILGVVSTKPGITLDDGSYEHTVPIALTGRVPVKISAENGPVLIGDYLTSSSTPGVAMKQTKAGMTIGRALTNYNGTSTDGSNTVIVFVETAFVNPEIYLSSTGDVEIKTDANADETFVYNGNFGQTETQITAASYTLANSAGQTVQAIGSYSNIASAKIKAGLIETKNLIVKNTLLAGNIIATNITATTAKINNLNVTEKIQSPVIETENLTVTETASIQKLETTQIVAPNGDLSIELGQNNNESQNNATPSSSLSKLIVKGLEGRTVATIDAAGNASFSGTIAASQVQTGSLTAESISSDSLSVQTATVETLAGKEASLSGKLIAKEVEADNIKDIVTNSQVLSQQVNDVQRLLADIRNQPTTDPSYYQTISDQQWESVTTESLNVTGDANLYTVTVANNLGVGNLLLENNSIISLSSELAFKALDKITFFDGSVVIAKDGTITTEGKIIAKAGIETDTIRPLSDSENVTIANLATNELSITDKFMSATSSAAVIAATDNFTRNGLFIPAIETSVETAGVGILPSEEYEIVIYNEKITNDSLIYLTPTKNIPDASLTVVDKKICTFAEVGCKNYFKVSTGTLNHPDLQFNWLIVN